MPEPGSPRVAIVTVNFHTEAEILRLLVSARVHRPFRDVQFIIVDNSPGHGVDFPLDPQDHYLPQETNIGFGPACNLGVRASRAPFIFFANPDLEFTGPLDALADTIRDDVAAASPLIAPPGYFQNRRLPTVGRFAWDFLGMPQLFPGNPISNDYYYQPPPRIPFDVEQPAAAAVLFSRERFLELEGFDPAFVPAWFEDVDLTFRILQRGWRCVCDPTFRVRHTMGVSAKAMGRTAFFGHYGKNCVRYFRKNRGSVQAAAVKGILAAGFLLRALKGSVSPALALRAWQW